MVGMSIMAGMGTRTGRYVHSHPYT